MTINTSTIIANIIRVPLLRNIFAVCLIIAIAFPFYSVLFVYPSFFDLLIKSTEDDAISTATHLTRMIIPEDTELNNNALSTRLMNEIEQMAKDFHLESLKIFIKTGQIIYSTNEKDIGRINNEKYFHNVVAKGNVYTNVVRKDTTSLEGRVVKSDVVETYVPLARNRKFNGAFEIYYDITDKKQKLDALLLCNAAPQWPVVSRQTSCTGTQVYYQSALPLSEEHSLLTGFEPAVFEGH